MSWDAPVPILEGETEDELISEFVRLSVQYPKFPPITVATEVFANRKEPQRALQAATRWSNNLAILRRIDEARLGLNDEPKTIKSKAEWHAMVLATTLDDNLGPQEKKARLEGFKLIAEGEGFTKAEAGDDEANSRRPIHVTFGLDPRAAEAEARNAA